MGKTIIIESRNSHSRYWREVLSYRELFWVLAWRDVSVRYKQTAIGFVWALLQPLFAMLVLTVIFGVLAKMPTEGETPYALLVLCGMLPWQMFANLFTGASNSVVNNAQLVSKVYFPRIIMPIAAGVVSLIDLLIGLGLLLLVMLYYGVMPSWQIVFLPVFVLMALLTALGPGLFFASVNVKYRDVKYLLPIIVQLGLYITPVGFSSSVVPASWQWLYALNPMVGVVDGFRWVFLGEAVEFDLQSFMLSWFIILLFAGCGMVVFRKMERGRRKG